MNVVKRMLGIWLVAGCAYGMLGNAAYAQDSIRLIVRGDDLGCTQGSLIAIERAFSEGILTCTGIQACAPWFDGAAALCRKHPEWCVGVHLSIIGEWQGYRWRPVLPWDKVPSIVDADGFFYASPEELIAHQPKLGEIEAELRAQIELVKKRGVTPGYLDTHSLGYRAYPGLEELFLRLSREYGLPLSGYAGETVFPGVYITPPAEKLGRAVALFDQLQPGLYLWVCHLGIDSPEQNALSHTPPKKAFAADGVGAHRRAELGVVTSDSVKAVIARKGIVLTNYTEVSGKRKP